MERHNIELIIKQRGKKVNISQLSDEELRKARFDLNQKMASVQVQITELQAIQKANNIQYDALLAEQERRARAKVKVTICKPSARGNSKKPKTSTEKLLSMGFTPEQAREMLAIAKKMKGE